MKTLKLQAAVSALLTASALSMATPSQAQSIFYPPSTTVSTGTQAAGNLPNSYSISGSGLAIFAWDGHNNSAAGFGWGWGHNATWVEFNLPSPASLDIKMSYVSGGSAYFNSAFTLWSTAGYTNPAGVSGNGHSFSQVSTASGAGVGPAPWLTATNEGGVTGFIGYANSGPTGWLNAVGLTVGSGTELNGTGYVNKVNVGNQNAELITTTLPAGKYLLAIGGSYACGSFTSAGGSVNNLASCAVTSGSGNWSLTINQTAAPTEPVTVPLPAGALGVLAAGLAGIIALGRRRLKA